MRSNAEVIRKELNQRRMTQRELADLVGVSERTVRNWLRIGGQYEASDRVLREVKRLLC